MRAGRRVDLGREEEQGGMKTEHDDTQSKVVLVEWSSTEEPWWQQIGAKVFGGGGLRSVQGRGLGANWLWEMMEGPEGSADLEFLEWIGRGRDHRGSRAQRQWGRYSDRQGAITVREHRA